MLIDSKYIHANQTPLPWGQTCKFHKQHLTTAVNTRGHTMDKCMVFLLPQRECFLSLWQLMQGVSWFDSLWDSGRIQRSLYTLMTSSPIKDTWLILNNQSTCPYYKNNKNISANIYITKYIHDKKVTAQQWLYDLILTWNSCCYAIQFFSHDFSP